MSWCKICGGPGRWRKGAKRQSVFFHAGSSDCGEYLSSRIVRGCLLRPTQCPECDAPCHAYTNEGGRQVLFDSLGPPWSAHAHAPAAKQAGAGWTRNEYDALEIEEIRATARLKSLLVRFRLEPSAEKVWVSVEDEKRSQFAKCVRQPFVARFFADDEYELSTFVQFNDRFETRWFLCRRESGIMEQGELF